MLATEPRDLYMQRCKKSYNVNDRLIKQVNYPVVIIGSTENHSGPSIKGLQVFLYQSAGQRCSQ
jgi:hypothetical protein